MGRREQRAELESTWVTYEPREPGTPFRKKDLVDAEDRAIAEAADAPKAPAVSRLPRRLRSVSRR